MNEQTILLVEDDFLNRRLCRKVLQENGYNVLEAKNAEEAFSWIESESIMLAIIDIHLGEDEKDGISIGYELMARYNIPFVYLTAYDNAEVVQKAVATTPYAYITKPFKNTDLLTTVALAIHQYKQSYKVQTTIMVKDGEFNVNLPIDEISFIESDGNYLIVYSKDKIYKCRGTIRQIQNELPENMFIQTHRAYIVNKSKIERFTAQNIIVGTTTIPISRNFSNVISELEKMN